MPEMYNSHYDKLVQRFSKSDDSIFEGCRIDKVDMSTMTATIYGLRSKQTKGNAYLLFPSLFLNTGIIAVPSIGSYALSFVGPTKETFVIPAQFVPPTREVTNSKVTGNASPAQWDKLFSLDFLEEGELYLASKNGARLILNNSGSVEFTTPSMHKVALNGETGSFEVMVERKDEMVGNYKMESSVKNIMGKSIQYTKTSLYEFYEGDSWSLSEAELKILAETGELQRELDLGVLVYEKQEGLVYVDNNVLQDAISQELWFVGSRLTKKKTIYSNGKEVDETFNGEGNTTTLSKDSDCIDLKTSVNESTWNVKISDSIVISENNRMKLEINREGIYFADGNHKYNLSNLLHKLNYICSELDIPSIEGENRD